MVCVLPKASHKHLYDLAENWVNLRQKRMILSSHIKKLVKGTVRGVLLFCLCCCFMRCSGSVINSLYVIGNFSVRCQFGKSDRSSLGANDLVRKADVKTDKEQISAVLKQRWSWEFHSCSSENNFISFYIPVIDALDGVLHKRLQLLGLKLTLVLNNKLLCKLMVEAKVTVV